MNEVLRNKIFNCINGISEVLDTKDLINNYPESITNKLNENMGLKVENLIIDDKNTFLYKVNLDVNNYIVSDLGYILHGKKVTNIFAGKNNMDLKSCVDDFANTIDVQFVNPNYAKDTVQDVRAVHQNLFDMYYILLDNNSSEDDIFKQFSRLKQFHDKLALENINLPMNTLIKEKNIHKIKEMQNNLFNISDEIMSNVKSFDYKGFFRNNNFVLQVSLNNLIVSGVNLSVERVPNDIIKANGSNNEPVVAIRDFGAIFRQINDIVKFDNNLSEIDLAQFIENENLKIMPNDEEPSTKISNFDNSLPITEYDLVLLGTERDVPNMFKEFMQAIYKVLNFIKLRLPNTTMRTKINSLLDSNISSYKISNDFNIAHNKISQLRNGKSKLDNLSFGNCEKLENAFNYYFVQNDMQLDIQDKVMQSAMENKFGLSDDQLNKIKQFIEKNNAHVTVRGKTATGKSVFISFMQHILKNKQIKVFDRIENMFTNKDNYSSFIWFSEMHALNNKDLMFWIKTYNSWNDHPRNIDNIMNDIDMDVMLDSKDENGKIKRYVTGVYVYNKNGKHDLLNE